MSLRSAPPTEEELLKLRQRLRAATETLEDIVRDRGALAELTAEERTRLIQAAGKVFNPDTTARRHLVKAAEKKRRAEGVARAERVLQDTGIRSLRRQAVFTTPNVFAPKEFEPADVAPGQDDADADVRPSPAARVAEEPKHCYVCKQRYSDIHFFYDQLCPSCAELNYRKRGEHADLTRPRGAAQRRAREDRLPGRHQAAAIGRASHCHHAISARCRQALCGGAGLS